MIQRLQTTLHEKVWGSPDTDPWCANPERRNIGEIWFAASDSVPLLVKLLFTSDNLSVQVHPKDEYAGVHHNSRGKTEMWHILRAAPDARIALGLREALEPEQLREVSLNGRIMELLNWIPVQPGDTYFVPAGTIHAIGGGLALCEVQQYSDITYRLYDYGRDRELHLDHGVAVSNLSAHTTGKAALPVECGYFRTDCVEVRGSTRIAGGRKLYIALSGEGSLGSERFRAGEAFEVDAGEFEIVSPHARFLVTEAR
ncbi:MAG: class I mannose-6-phosphate isomerase [Acidobacteriota bacterium]|nr:class I mannose-6-phosphate isomerase [Acidobacteriota bacterium]